VYGFLLVFFGNFVPKIHRFLDIRLQKCRDLENRVRGPSKSLKMSPLKGAQNTKGGKYKIWPTTQKGWLQNTIYLFPWNWEPALDVRKLK